jgi:hypothetical protein
MYVKVFNGSSWSGWTPLGGYLTSDPGAVVLGSDVYLFGRGSDNAFWLNQRTGSWSGWQSLGGILNSDPAPVADSSSIWLFARGGSALWYRRLVGGTWSGWAQLGGSGTITSNPEPVADGANVSVFARLSDGSLGVLRFDGSNWDPAWTSLGGSLAPVAGTA